MSIYRIITAILFLVIGMCIYLLFRQDVIFLRWVDSDILDCLHVKISDNVSSGWVYMLLYCLPDALWYAALLILQIPFYRGGLLNRMLLYLCIVLPYIMEILQYIGLMPGTFDWFDILTYFITLIILLLCEKLFSNLE